MQAPNLPFGGKLRGCPCPGLPALWQQSVFFQINSKFFAKPSSPGAHLTLLGDTGRLEGFQACPEFIQSLCLDGGSFSLMSQTLLLVTVQVILLLRPLKHIRPVWVCLLKHEGESSNSRVVSV